MDPAPARTDVLSDDQLARDNARHLPTDNVVGRIDPAGDLLRQCAANAPASPDLQWFTKLSPAMRDQVVSELNHYVFTLHDDLLVKARLTDDYDMRWRFKDNSPRKLAIQSPDLPTGISKSLTVSAVEIQTIPRSRDANDSRHMKVRFVWKINPGTTWNSGEKMPGNTFQFTLPLEYNADCWVINHVPHREESLGGIGSLEKLANGQIKMTVRDDANKLFTLRLALNGEGELTMVTAKPGDTIAPYSPDLLGAGAGGYKFLGEYDGYLRFESHSWFYEIMPSEQKIIELRPYSHKTVETAPTTKPGPAS